MTWKVWAELAAAVGIFVAGYEYAAALYGEDIAALREDYASRALALEEKYRAREAENAKAVVAAWEARDRALASADDLSSELGRVRDEADRARRELSRAGTDPCGPCREQLARGAELVARGAELLGRCRDMAERTAIDKDAVTALTQ
ncbi:MAG: hypothetical protein SPH18_07205 [Sutterella parvirubra]|nr:hypothetical protein [Sutterella parvirubra]